MITLNDKLSKPITLRPSKLSMQLITLGHFLGVVAIFSNRLNILLQLLLLTTLSIHYAWQIYTWKRCNNLTLYCHSNTWLISNDQWKTPLYTVLGCSYWHPWLVILKVSNRSSKKSYLPIVIDSCKRYDFKRLQLIAVSQLNDKRIT